MVFQTPALYPHLRVFDNLAFGLSRAGGGMTRPALIARAMFPRLGRRMERLRKQVEAVAEAVQVGHLLERYPAELSGGERQRAALGRALARSPELFLFDEPLAAVDVPLRAALRCEIKALHQRLGATMVYVTHDQAEALALGERVAVLHQGRVQQVAEPASLCARPANRWVAELVGVPPMCLVSGRLVPPGLFHAERGWRVTLPLPAWQRLERLALRPLWAGWPAGAVVLEACRAAAQQLAGPVAGRAMLVEPSTAGAFVHVAIGATGGALDRLVTHSAGSFPRPGQPLSVWLDFDRVHWFDGGSGERLSVVTMHHEEGSVQQEAASINQG